jgi:hypothetical protein
LKTVCGVTVITSAGKRPASSAPKTALRKRPIDRALTVRTPGLAFATFGHHPLGK